MWLDTPMIETIHGEGTIETRIPAMLRMFMNYGIDMRKEPILVYPTLHYQNGGVEINGDGFVPQVENLLAAGEVVGGISIRLSGLKRLPSPVLAPTKPAAASCFLPFFLTYPTMNFPIAATRSVCTCGKRKAHP